MLDTARHREIEQRLLEQLDRARLAHVSATARFDLLVKECQSGLPHPDGSLRIHQAGKDSRLALHHYMQALTRFTEFILRGTVPEDLFPTRFGATDNSS